MALSPVDFEVQLKLKGATECEDRSLMNRREHYIGCSSADCLETVTFENYLCTAELSVEELSGSIQATFLGIRVAEPVHALSNTEAGSPAPRRFTKLWSWILKAP
ncbi:hypothetical protein ZWY2020_011539 [Hordeum vulgare]|nr:hypothetical protein ZWY2020_011539 [Hordeum vulgare]